MSHRVSADGRRVQTRVWYRHGDVAAVTKHLVYERRHSDHVTRVVQLKVVT